MLVATINNVILHSVSHNGEIVTIWENPDTTFTKYHLRPDSEHNIEVNYYETYEELVDSLNLHAWILQGVKSTRLMDAIQKHG